MSSRCLGTCLQCLFGGCGMLACCVCAAFAWRVCRCDGVSHTCPSRKRLVRDGEPCVVEDGGSLPDGQAGPYTEVLDATGKVCVSLHERCC